MQLSNKENPTPRIGKIKEERGKSTFYPVSSQGNFVETFHDLVLNDFELLTTETGRVSYGSGYLNNKEKMALKQLSSNNQIVIPAADKGGGIVIQNYQDYHAEALKILSDEVYYQ